MGDFSRTACPHSPQEGLHQKIHNVRLRRLQAQGYLPGVVARRTTATVRFDSVSQGCLGVEVRGTRQAAATAPLDSLALFALVQTLT